MKELSATAITAGLKTRVIGQRLVYFPSLASTMDTARDEVRRGATEGTVVMAGEQMGGRGRLKRNWVSPSGNIALSIILYPDVKAIPYLIMIASLAAARSIEGATGLKTGIKWPNDVLIEGRKVSGILIENEVKGNKAASVTGIGINIDLNAADYPEIADTAASLKSSGKADFRVEIIRALLTEFERLYLTLPDGKPIFEAWRGRLATLGEKVRATGGGETIEGVAEDADESGALWIRGAEGRLTKVVAGEVTLRGNRD
ncbi:MAG: biotin--[acetyl-CoA-carboxylase] ligase [Dehalococcoidales bacterium]|jgi:BirA family biotin operon repressor/biotin-[acetyl-CoA-carboxylase] ligase